LKRADDDSKILDLFGGELLNVMTCKECDDGSPTSDIFTDLQIQIPQPDKGKRSLVECLSDYFKEDLLNGGVSSSCGNCKKVCQRSIKSSLLSTRVHKRSI
jgi:ubiquitin C-terminal hydrolase